MNLREIFKLETLPTWTELRLLVDKIGLDSNDVFTKVSDEVIEREFNYIGADRTPKIIREMLSKFNVEILPAVLIHDLDYVVGGTTDDFFASNKRLRKNMLKCVYYHRKEISIFRIILYIFKAFEFKRICDKFGLPGWNLKE